VPAASYLAEFLWHLSSSSEVPRNPAFSGLFWGMDREGWLTKILVLDLTGYIFFGCQIHGSGFVSSLDLIQVSKAIDLIPKQINQYIP